MFLGILVGVNPRRRETWNPILAKLRRRLSSWQGKQMSLDVRVVMMNVPLINIPVYYLSFFKASKAVLNEIMKTQCAFLWRGEETWRTSPEVKHCEIFHLSL